MSLVQYKAAERDSEYFLSLIDVALTCFIDVMDIKGQSQ
jgi:hypothetical protein